MKITALVAPYRPDVMAPTVVGPRVFDHVDEFATALGNAANTSVPVIEGALGDAPTDGYVILFEWPSIAENFSIASRAIVVNANRSSVLSRLERERPAGAIEQHRYFLWRTQPSQESGSGLFGRKEVITPMGAALVPGPFQTEHYGLMSSDSHQDLPSLVAGYLSFYDDLRNSGALRI